MYLKLFEISFIIFGLIFILQMVLLEIGITKRMTTMKASDFVSSAAAILLFYISNALVLSILVCGISRIFMLLFAIIPFILGKLAKYETHKIYNTAQLLIIFCGIIYTVYLFV